MKKFFTNIPHQIRGQLQTYRYDAVDNPMLQMEEETSFPILTAINGYAQAGEEIRIIAVTTDLQSDTRNSDAFRAAAEDLCRRKGVLLPKGVELIFAQNDERVQSQTDTFLQLIDKVEENDDLYSCLTFGTKPQAMALQMAVQYAYRVKNNTSIGCILYGKINRDDNGQSYGQVYDMTLLTRLLADKHLPNPGEIIRQALCD